MVLLCESGASQASRIVVMLAKIMFVSDGRCCVYGQSGLWRVGWVGGSGSGACVRYTGPENVLVRVWVWGG